MRFEACTGTPTKAQDSFVDVFDKFIHKKILFSAYNIDDMFACFFSVWVHEMRFCISFVWMYATSFKSVGWFS